MAYLARTQVGAASLALASLALVGSNACSKHEAPTDVRPPTASAAERLASAPARSEQLVAWGPAPDGLTLRAGGRDRLAEGPDAVAVGPDGRALVLDRLGGRIVRIGDRGDLRTAATTPADAQELAASADGSLLAFSPLRARAWIFHADGSEAGELAVPRELQLLQSLSLGPSHRVEAHLAYQQTVELGSPAAPLSLGASLRTLRAGALNLPDGRGLVCAARDGHAELRIVTVPTTADGRPEIAARFAVEGHATAARLVGLDGSVACMRLESVSSTPALEVGRRAVCLDVESGSTVLDEPLGTPGVFVPRIELATGGGRLAFMRPTTEGLELTSWALRGVADVKEVTP